MFLFVTMGLYNYLFPSCISRMQKARGNLRYAQSERNNFEKIQPAECRDSKIPKEYNSKYTSGISHKSLQQNIQQQIQENIFELMDKIMVYFSLCSTAAV